ncbi:metallophosphoesterase family protein [Candidatus Harpocratesius sp.]
MNSDEFQEENEYNERTHKIGQKYHTSLQSTFMSIEKTQTQMIMEGRTQRIGETEEQSIIDEFWDYYRQFSSENPPHEAEYYGDDASELKMTILIRQFQDFYLEKIYPLSFPVPIIQKSYKSTKNTRKRPAKFFIVGDTHGSFADVAKLINFFVPAIEKGKQLGYDVKIIIIGDIVDRGKWDLHNLLYLMTFNLKYPTNVLILRGNHEEMSISANYGFGRRVMKYFSEILFASFCHMFKDLPLISIFHCENGSFLCLHGGIPITIDPKTGDYDVPLLNIYNFNNRQVWIDEMDPVSQQILWNDPIINYVPGVSEQFFDNRRGIGYTFGEEIFRTFCVKNHIDLVFRGHQVFSEGFHRDFDDKFITVFSASNYVNKNIQARFVELNSTDIFNFAIHLIQDMPG